jgi:N-formylglutamate amidohydrolase
VLFDAHSIRSHVPRFFEGRLWDLNFGSRHGKTADGELVRRVMAVAETATDYSSVLDGRFTGGYNTAHYGQPTNGVHAVQLEMAWSCYMDETPPFAYRPDLADGIRPTLRRLLQAMIDWATD